MAPRPLITRSFTNDAATVSGSGGGFTEFRDASTAGNGTFINNGATVSGAGGGFTYFYDTSTAGNATLVAKGGTGGGLGGTIFFQDNSTGGTSRVEIFGNGNLDLDPVLLNGFVPAIGDSFTFMNYTSLTGEFFIHDRNFNGGLEHWSVGYQPTYAVLTAEAGRVPVPDYASTLLLLTLGLVGLVTPRYFLLRKQA